MSYQHVQHVQQLALIREDHGASLATLRYVDENWGSLSVLHASALAQRHGQSALSRLDATYIIRAFAEFEQILRDSGAAMQPVIQAYTGDDSLIASRCASAFRMIFVTGRSRCGSTGIRWSTEAETPLC